MKLYTSTRDHPQSDGQFENGNQNTEDTLRHFVGPFQTDWKKLLPMVKFAMNNSWNSTIQHAPFKYGMGSTPMILRLLPHALAIMPSTCSWASGLSSLSALNVT